jgi:spore germination protein
VIPASTKLLATFALGLMVATASGASKEKAGSTPATRPTPALLRERQKVLSARPLAMYYYLDGLGIPSIEQNASQMTVLGPQCFALEADGVIRGEVPPPLAELARRKGLPIMPLLVNPGFDRSVASAMLRSPPLQERAASYLAYLAQRENFVGWQLDLEYIDPADKAHYSAFVRRVAAKLHRDGRLLSVAVTPRFSDHYPDTRKAEFRTGEWGAPFDYRALGQAADFVVLMTYDQHTAGTPPGPVAGKDWVRAALDYAVSRVPHLKLVMGIPFYGREWVNTPHGAISRSLTYETLRPLIERPGVLIQWHDRWKTPWAQFREEPDTHTIWFDDARSYREKLQLARQYRLRGFAAWRLGTENPEFWAVAAEQSKPRPKPERPTRDQRPAASPAPRRGAGSQ